MTYLVQYRLGGAKIKAPETSWLNWGSTLHHANKQAAEKHAGELARVVALYNRSEITFRVVPTARTR